MQADMPRAAETALDPVARTAYYCCGVRAEDARRRRPLCNDRFAERFMDDAARAVFARFAHLRGPNLANAARHRIIDDLLRAKLAERPDTLVVLLGAGFDTRAFRLPGGRWVELDQPALIALKQARLPAGQAPNPLHRVPIDFARVSLAGKLAPWAGTPRALVVMEGVIVYLSADALRATAHALAQSLPQHALVCDLMTDGFVRGFGGPIRRVIRDLGAEFAPTLDDPAAFVAGLGYREIAGHSIAARTAELGPLPWPRWLLPRTLRDGYQVHVFEAAQPPVTQPRCPPP